METYAISGATLRALVLAASAWSAENEDGAFRAIAAHVSDAIDEARIITARAGERAA